MSAMGRLGPCRLSLLKVSGLGWPGRLVEWGRSDKGGGLRSEEGVGADRARLTVTRGSHRRAAGHGGAGEITRTGDGAGVGDGVAREPIFAKNPSFRSGWRC
ncbi:hypothetical protein GCM10018966_053840 [Streptomyces yanii]